MTVITIAIAIVFAIDIAIGIAIAIYDATEIQKCNRMQQKCNGNATEMRQRRMTRFGGGEATPPDEDHATGLAEVAGGAPSRTRARKRGSTGGSPGGSPGAFPRRGSRGEAGPEDRALLPHRGRGTGFCEAVAGGASPQSEGRQTGAAR